MTDINMYRSRIGLFSPKMREKKFLYKSEYYSKFYGSDNQSGRITFSTLKFIFKLVLFLGLLCPAMMSETNRVTSKPAHQTRLGCIVSITHSGAEAVLPHWSLF